MVAAGCLILENFVGASKFLSMNGLPKSPLSTIAISTVPIGLALLSVAISNGTTYVTVFF